MSSQLQTSRGWLIQKRYITKNNITCMAKSQAEVVFFKFYFYTKKQWLIQKIRKLMFYEILFWQPYLVCLICPICQNIDTWTIYVISCQLCKIYTPPYRNHSTIKFSDVDNIYKHDFKIDQSQWFHPLTG